MGLKLSSISVQVSDEGEWVDSANWPGVRYKVRSIAVRDYQIQRDLLVQRKVRALNRVPTGPEMEPDLSKLKARHLLRGWEGLLGDDDKAIGFSPEKAIELLTDPTMSALEQDVTLAASRVGERDAEFTADAVKNSQAPSATN